MLYQEQQGLESDNKKLVSSSHRHCYRKKQKITYFSFEPKSVYREDISFADTSCDQKRDNGENLLCVQRPRRRAAIPLSIQYYTKGEDLVYTWTTRACVWGTGTSTFFFDQSQQGGSFRTWEDKQTAENNRG